MLSSLHLQCMKFGKGEGDLKMEASEHGFFEEYLSAPSLTEYPPTSEINDQQVFSNALSCGTFYESFDLATSNVSFSELTTSSQLELPTFAFPYSEVCPFVNGYPGPQDVIDSSYLIKNDEPPFPGLQDHDFLFHDPQNLIKERNDGCRLKNEKDQTPVGYDQAFNVGSSGDRKRKALKIEGQPSKNLMAERRRRKRLNDRLSMLRSVVPKITKMDRTSIVGDTIDYVKDLQEKIHNLKEELETKAGNNQEPNIVGTMNKNVAKVKRKTESKFDVERKQEGIHIEISCATKPGLLLSTVSTIEALGLDIQQCVISCFGDYSLQASCSEAKDNWKFTGCEDIKQALYRSAGYGGRCF